jgi:hypothetical protein
VDVPAEEAEELVSETAEEPAFELEEGSEPAAAFPESAPAPLVPLLGVVVGVPAVAEPAWDPAGFAVNG